MTLDSIGQNVMHDRADLAGERSGSERIAVATRAANPESEFCGPLPKRAVILAAGLGSRLRPLTNERPKPLVEVHGTPILHSALRALSRFGVTDATVVVGYRKELIRQSIASSFSDVDITYVDSPVFDSTGSAYSLWLAREALLQGDTFLLEGDVIFESAVLERLLASQLEDAAAVAPFDDTMTGSAVTLDSAGHISSFRMNQTAADLACGIPLYKTMNVLRLSERTLRSAFVPALDRFIKRGEVRGYVEQVMAELVNDLGWNLPAVQCGDLKWFEIDSAADLHLAERIFARSPRIKGAAGLETVTHTREAHQ